MGNKIIILGLGETAELALEYFTHDSDHEVVAFTADDKYCEEATFLNKPVVKFSTLLSEFPPSDYKLFVAVSSSKLNRLRQELYEKVKALGYECVSYVSSKAFVWHDVKIGDNCFIFENNVLQYGVEVGNNVILWSGNHVGHQTKIKDHVFVSSHCVISGFCEVGENSFLGVNCTLANNVNVARDCFVGMGAVVGKGLPENTLIRPARSEISKITAMQLCQVG